MCIRDSNKLLKEIKARITRLYNWSKAEAEKPVGQQPSMIDLWEAQQQLKRPDTRTGKIRALQESAALFSFCLLYTSAAIAGGLPDGKGGAGRIRRTAPAAL